MADDSVLHKKLLGRELQMLRQHAECGLEEAAQHLSRTHNSIRRFENGQTLIDALQLRTLCELYGADPAARQRLDALREMARQPAWWSGLGPRPNATASMLSIESAARKIREYDHAAIPGLLQTPGYARSNITAVDIHISQEQIDLDVELRVFRQKKLWETDPPPHAHFLVDESAFHRMPGSGESRRAQLAQLLALPPTVTLQVVPFGAGPHASLGTYLIFDLDLDSPAITRSVYVEGSVSQQGVITENEPDISKYELAFERTLAKALSPKETVEFIQNRIRGTADD